MDFAASVYLSEAHCPIIVLWLISRIWVSCFELSILESHSHILTQLQSPILLFLLSTVLTLVQIAVSCFDSSPDPSLLFELSCWILVSYFWLSCRISVSYFDSSPESQTLILTQLMNLSLLFWISCRISVSYFDSAAELSLLFWLSCRIAGL